MPRKISLVLVGLLLLGPTATASAERSLPPAVQTQTYLGPNGVRTAHYDQQLEQIPQGVPMVFSPRPGDRSVSLEVEDAYGRIALIHVLQEDPASGEMTKHTFCASKSVIPVVGDAPLNVFIYNGLCTNHNVGTATTGTVTARFSRATTGTSGHSGHHR